MASYEDDGYSSGAMPNTGNGESFGAHASKFTVPILSSGIVFVRDMVESAQIIVSQSPIAKGTINVFMVLTFVYCVLSLAFPRHLRGVIRAIRTPA